MSTNLTNVPTIDSGVYAPLSEYVTRRFIESGITYTQAELTQCLMSLGEIQALTDSEDLCRLVFDVVFKQQMDKYLASAWIAIELAFEVTVAMSFNRDRAVLACTERVKGLEVNPDVDIYLDIHNDRKSRFEKYLCWCGLPAIVHGKPIPITS